jgi:hypothetical protein
LFGLKDKAQNSMAPMLRRVLVLLSIFVAFTSTAAADDPFKRLEVKLTQSGFAGESGSLWIIQPSGKWSRQDIVASEVQPVESQNTGVLTKEQLDQLSRVLQQNDVGSLPERLGTNTRANPRRLAIQWGDKRIEVVTPADIDPLRSNSPGPENQAGAIAEAVQQLTQK